MASLAGKSCLQCADEGETLDDAQLNNGAMGGNKPTQLSHSGPTVGNHKQCVHRHISAAFVCQPPAVAVRVSGQLINTQQTKQNGTTGRPHWLDRPPVNVARQAPTWHDRPPQWQQLTMLPHAHTARAQTAAQAAGLHNGKQKATHTKKQNAMIESPKQTIKPKPQAQANSNTAAGIYEQQSQDKCAGLKQPEENDMMVSTERMVICAARAASTAADATAAASQKPTTTTVQTSCACVHLPT